MMKKKVSTYFFIALLLAVLYLALLVIGPYVGFIILAIVLAYTTYPLYQWFKKKLPKEWMAAGLMVFLVIIIIFIPSIFLMKSLVAQGSATISNFNVDNIQSITDSFNMRFNTHIDIAFVLTGLTSKLKDFLIAESFNVLSSIADVALGLLVMFFVLFYLFKDGKKLYHALVDILPLEEKHKRVLFGEMQIVTNAVIYGQLVLALIQGILGGMAFVIFGLNNAVFWGFIIAIVSFLPLVGTLIIFIPAGIIELLAKDYVSGFGIIIFGIVLVMNVDSIVKPLIISDKSRLNAALILIGVIGGLKAFGFMGFIIGPLVLALLFALLQAFKQDFKPSAELESISKNKNNLIIPLHKRPADTHRRVKKKSVKRGKKNV